MTSPLTVDVWSDVACPWCRIGRANLGPALAEFAHADEVVVTWHSFELDPQAPATSDLSVGQMLAAKYGTDEAGVAAMWERVGEYGSQAGLRFDFANAKQGNTFDAHRLLHLAAERGVQDALLDDLFTAQHERGAALGDSAELSRIAVAAGLDADEVDAVLAGDAYAEQVRADEQLAARLGVSGVPFFVIDGQYGLNGAQPADQLLAALDQAWATGH
jgi:predicted DsbA family dithiol-disulfide isomerase